LACDAEIIGRAAEPHPQADRRPLNLLCTRFVSAARQSPWSASCSMISRQVVCDRRRTMNGPHRERDRAIFTDLVGLAILGILMATVIEALSPENLLRRDTGVMAEAAPGVVVLSRVA
jgi:hypothetical protein